MGSATPASTPDIMSTAYESPFHSKSLTITVGTQRVPFTVHEAKLARTNFFNVHDPITDEEAETLVASTDGSACRIVKLEDDHDLTMRIPILVPDYHIQDRFFLTAAAFDIFVKYLYNELPPRPMNKRAITNMLRAYGIAILYKCYGLQNTIMDRLRAYYSRTSFEFDNLIWAANRFGDDTAYALRAYFVQQVAFEISDRGFAEYAEKNSSLRTFIQQGDDKAIRVALFEALSQYAHGTSKDDPAITGYRFHVYENGEHAGQLKG